MVDCKVYSAFDPPPVEPSPSGDGLAAVYKLDPETDTVVLDGYEDLQAKIQAATDSCDLQKLIARFNQTQDQSIFYQRAAMFGDFASAPHSLAEAQKMLIDAKHDFEHLPEEVRKVFDFSFNKYAQAAGDGTLRSKLEPFMPKRIQKDMEKKEGEE